MPHAFTACGAGRFLIKPKSCAHLFGGTSSHQNPLLTAARPTENLYGIQWHPTSPGEKSTQFFVRRPIGRRCRHANFHRVTMEPCTLGTGGFGLDMHRNDGALGSGANNLFP